MAKIDQQDLIYAETMDTVGDFVFDDKVAHVFSDMINRSVPGYATIIRMIALLSSKHVPPHGICYDLGCSLGAAALAMSHALDSESGGKVIAVDNSEAMIERAREQINQANADSYIDLECGDVRDVEIKDASMVVLNFTLQFIPLEQREALLRKIYKGLLPGGILVLSEKICFDDRGFNDLFIDMHHQYKRDQGYSDLEISQKRTALENVLLPETLNVHGERLNRVGFNRHSVWFQCFNFISLLAVK